MPGENNDKQKPAGGSRGGQEVHDWERVLAEAKSGDSAALTKLSKYVCRYACAFAGHRRLPPGFTEDDLTQEVVTAFLKQLASIRHLPSWLSTVCMRAEARFIREFRRKRFESLDAIAERLGDSVPATMQTASESSHIDHNLDFDSFLKCLTPDQRLVFVMHYMDELAYAEIAKFLNKSITAVRLDAFYARRKLQRMITQKHGEGRHHGFDAHRAQKR